MRFGLRRIEVERSFKILPGRLEFVRIEIRIAQVDVDDRTLARFCSLEIREACRTSIARAVQQITQRDQRVEMCAVPRWITLI